jgi:hypothetical protein
LVVISIYNLNYISIYLNNSAFEFAPTEILCALANETVNNKKNSSFFI